MSALPTAASRIWQSVSSQQGLEDNDETLGPSNST